MWFLPGLLCVLKIWPGVNSPVFIKSSTCHPPTLRISPRGPAWVEKLCSNPSLSYASPKMPLRLEAQVTWKVYPGRPNREKSSIGTKGRIQYRCEIFPSYLLVVPNKVETSVNYLSQNGWNWRFIRIRYWRMWRSGCDHCRMLKHLTYYYKSNTCQI